MTPPPAASKSYHIEVRLIGRDLTAERVAARDAAALITAVESLLSALIPESGGQPAGENEVVLSLAELRPTGCTLVFATPQPEGVARAFARAAQALETGQFDPLPIRAVEGLREARRIARRYGVEVEFVGRSGGSGGGLRASVLPGTRLEPVFVGLRGTTSLYGTVIRVGGEEPPRARLRLINDAVITCDLAHRKSWSLARELGARLYQVVGVRGEALYSLSLRGPISFRIDRVLPYNPEGREKALDALSAFGGAAFPTLPDALTSPDRALRGDDE